MAGRRKLTAGQTTSSRYKGSDGRWHARVTMGTRLDGSPVRKHLSRSTKADLDRAVRELERSRDNGQYQWTEADPSLGQWLDHWLTAVLPMTVRWKTLSSYTSAMRLHVLPALGAMRLSELRPETLEQHYRQLLAAGRSEHVVHAVHRVLRSSLNEAVRRQRLAVNPAQVARPPRVPAEEVEPLTREECRRILAVVPGRRNAARWSIALALGLRQGEALGLRWSDVDFDSGTLRVRRAVQRQTWKHGCVPAGVTAACGRRRAGNCPLRRDGGLLVVETKAKASKRTIALPGPLLDELRRHRRTQAAERLAAARGTHGMDLLFPDESGSLVDPGRDRREWKSILREADVRDARLHDARHTAATLLLVQGVDARTVMAIMGWTEMSTAQRYAHAVDELRREAARRMGNALWPESTASPTPPESMT